MSCYDFSESVDQILSIIDEATTRNYPEFVMKSDLNNFLIQLYKSQEDYFQEELKWAVESAEEEVRDNCYEDAFDEGKEEGEYEGYQKFIRKLAVKIIELKKRLREEELSNNEVQKLLTELLVDLDDNEEIVYTNIEQQLKDLDQPLTDS